MIYSIGVAFVIFTVQSLISMQLTETKIIQHSFTLVTDEKPPKKFPISFEIAMQCQTIKAMVGDLIPENQKEPMTIDIPISETLGNGIPYFLDYIQLVSSLNIEPEKSEEYTKIDDQLDLYTRILFDSELIDLFVLVDYFNVIDRNKNGHLTQAVANKIIKGSTNLESFYHLNGRSLFRNVIKKVNKEVNLTQKLIQPYSDELIARHQLVRTIPISTALYYNIRNLLAAPFRVIGLLPFIGPFLGQQKQF